MKILSKIFNHRKQSKQKGWKDINLRQFNEILGYAVNPDEYTELNILGAIYPEVDFFSLPITEFNEYKSALAFLKDEVPEEKLKKYYTINGRVYDSSFDLSEVSVAQFIDFNNYVTKEKVKYEEMLSVFFIPKGHMYNDGYDMNQVMNDMLDLSFVTVKSAAFFFVLQLHVYVIAFQRYLEEDLKKTETTTDDQRMIKEKILRDLEKVDLINLV